MYISQPLLNPSNPPITLTGFSRRYTISFSIKFFCICFYHSINLWLLTKFLRCILANQWLYCQWPHKRHTRIWVCQWRAKCLQLWANNILQEDLISTRSSKSFHHWLQIQLDTNNQLGACQEVVEWLLWSTQIPDGGCWGPGWISNSWDRIDMYHNLQYVKSKKRVIHAWMVDGNSHPIQQEIRNLWSWLVNTTCSRCCLLGHHQNNGICYSSIC